MATETQSAAEASAPGMPQLDITTFGNQIFWLLSSARCNIFRTVARCSAAHRGHSCQSAGDHYKRHRCGRRP